MDINLEPEEGCLTWHVAIPRVDFEYHELVLNENKLVRIVIKKISSGIFDFTIITQGIYDKILAQKEGVKVLYKNIGIFICN